MADELAAADNALAVARDVLKRAPLIDGHNDLPWVIRVDRAARGDVVAYDLNRVHERADTDIPRLREGMVGAQFWAAFQPTNAPHPARTALEQIDLIRRIEEAHPDVFLPARQAADYARAKALGKIASFIAVEGGVGLENSLSPLRIWHAAGMRLMTLCHNETLDWVNSATDAPRNDGLNAFGRAIIGELNRLGIVIDLAHTSHDAMRRVLDVTEAPVALSHSNAFSLCDHPRNTPDDVLKRLKANGGLVMATFVPGFVSQALRDWLRRSRDGYGKAPLAADPKAQLAELETKHGVGAESEPRAGRRPHRPPGRDRRPRPCWRRLRLFRRGFAGRARRREPLSASVRGAGAPRLFRARPREDVVEEHAARAAAGRNGRRILAQDPAARDRQARRLPRGVSGGAMAPAVIDWTRLECRRRTHAGPCPRSERAPQGAAHEGRLMILCDLLHGEKSVGELEAAAVTERQASVSQQLARLRLEGLVSTRGRRTIYYASPMIGPLVIGALYFLLGLPGAA